MASENLREAAQQEPEMPWIFLHGSGDSGRAWDGVIARLGRMAPHAFALDLPGHGARIEEPLPDPPRVEGYAEAVRQQLRDRGIVRATVVGHSLGSAVALRLALDAPELVARVALVGAGARLRVLPALLALARTDPAEAWRRVVELGHAPEHAGLVAPYLAATAATAPGALYADLAACDAFDAMGELGNVRQSALVVVGAEDRLTPPTYAAYLADHLPNATLISIAGAGHYLMDEAPAALADTLRKWGGETGP